MIDDRRAERIQVVLGADGGAGGAVVRELVGQGRWVRAVPPRGVAAAHRGAHPPASYEDIAADVTRPGELRLALAGASVVYHCAQPPYRRWAQQFPAMTRGIMEAAAEVGAKLVYADNLYMYGPTPDPLSERTPPVAQTLKGRVRAAMADELLRAHGEGRLRVVVARSSDYYGPGGLRSVLGERFFGAILAGGKVRWLGSLDQPHTVSYLGDVARALVLLGEHEGADGQVWHTPAPPPLTGRKFIALAARAAGSQAVPSLLSLRAVRVLGVAVPVLRELPELWYQWARPFESDSRKFQHAFGPFSVTSHEDALRATVEWYRGYFAGSDGLDEVAHLVRSNQT